MGVYRGLLRWLKSNEDGGREKASDSRPAIAALRRSPAGTRYVGRQGLLFGFFLTTNVLLNTFSWQHHFVWLIPAFFIAFKYLEGHPVGLVPLLVSYLLIAGNLKNPSPHLPISLSPYLSLFRSHVFIGGFLLWIILGLLILHEEVARGNATSSRGSL